MSMATQWKLLRNKEHKHRNTYQYINTFIKFLSLPTHIRIMLSILNIQIMHSFHYN